MELIVLSISNILCFFIGAKIGQKVVRNEKIEIPTPKVIIKEHKKMKEEQKEIDNFNKILQNINNYDGSDIGQVEVK